MLILSLLFKISSSVILPLILSNSSLKISFIYLYASLTCVILFAPVIITLPLWNTEIVIWTHNDFLPLLIQLGLQWHLPCSFLFLIYYGFFRVISEFFREPDIQLGYLFSLFSMGTILSLLMIIVGIILFVLVRRNEIKS